MDIVPLGPDHDLVPAYVDLVNAAEAVDAPWSHPSIVGRTRAWLRYGWELEPSQVFVAVEDGAVVGASAVSASEYDNRDHAWLGAVVHPERRQTGLGTALMDHAEGVAREMGRPKIGADAWEGTPGIGFLERRGYRRASQAIMRRQHLDRVDLDMVGKLRDEALAHAEGYELLRILGAVPEDMAEAMTGVISGINDAPTDDLDIEDEVFSVQRLRNYEASLDGFGTRVYRVVARHRETGELAGHSVIGVDDWDPRAGHQHDTSVVAAHRGRRLGLLLKSDMVLWLTEAEPQLRTVDTFNAESNGHMIAVNELLGYEWTARDVQLQRLEGQEATR